MVVSFHQVCMSLRKEACTSLEYEHTPDLWSSSILQTDIFQIKIGVSSSSLSGMPLEDFMSRSQAEKAAIHEKIVHLAAERFREVGLNGIGVADLMKEAGRTGGGFYKHFESRDKLVEEALECAFNQRKSRLEEYTAPQSTLTLADFVERYLSEEHLNAPGSGCALTALVNDVARSGDDIRQLFTHEVESELAVVADLMPGRQTAKKRANAILVLCSVVGAMGLSRAVSDPALAAELLATSKTLLKAVNA
jgi:TetR/AcrR family transcriptional repressor of nem operon